MQTDSIQLDIFLTHQAALIDYAAHIVGCRSRAEDVVQEAFIRFSAGDGRIASPAQYLFRIVRNLALDWARRAAHETWPADTEMERMAAATPSPEHATQYRHELRLVAEALADLPERTRIAFEMHRLGGHTLQSVAAALGISTALAHILVHQAVTRCAERLGDIASPAPSDRSGRRSSR